MSYSKPNASAATKTRNRVAPSPSSGLCVTCLDGCPGLCEVGRSALRGREAIYPQPFGKVTAGSEKDYPIDFSHFNIQGSCVGAVGIEANSDKAIFTAVDISTEVGGDGKKIKMKVPFLTGALGSTEIARVNWEGAAIASAICGSILVCGENVCGMDVDAEIRNGRVIKSPELARRMKIFRDWYDGYGMLLVQANIEDTRLGVPEYAVEKLGVEGIEIKWGQGAKDIGGEVKLPSLERALQLKKRGYIVIPDPEDPVIQESFKLGAIKEFERHSRVGMVEEEAFLKQVDGLRNIGTKYVTLKTGAYRPADLARAVKFASEAKIDLLTVDGAGGGTGMSPWRMMNEWGIPTVYLECLLYEYLTRLEEKGAFIPSCAIAGGFALEDQIFKAIALGSPYIKAVCLGRATLSAAMVGKTNGEKIAEEHGKDDGYEEALMQTFVNVGKLREKYGKDFSRIPPAAIGMYNYYDRLTTGLQQLMAGTRKFRLDLIERDDLMSLTKEVAEISGIPYIMDTDREEVERILA
ncbi:MAG: FMN-binding glutamate synthase family protein [Chloroflexi bacterium CG07_land_8_20_14_0_80_45_17]|nr:MAG: FMN-binding glutamate synthase family protein [Chloroflexi bacterium CG23_combo_of_CG06-09_8_20_14_all_45_10]PIU57053.1 MAG: FMN-binding glutamate synthase family protein [Chloroflexi bacterium CG07_land_8_20_14_0_80_45_17]